MSKVVVPFSQIHGHSTIVSYTDRTWRAPGRVRQRSTVDWDARQFRVRIGGRTFIGVGPRHGRAGSLPALCEMREDQRRACGRPAPTGAHFRSRQGVLCRPRPCRADGPPLDGLRHVQLLRRRRRLGVRGRGRCTGHRTCSSPCGSTRTATCSSSSPVPGDIDACRPRSKPEPSRISRLT